MTLVSDVKKRRRLNTSVKIARKQAFAPTSMALPATAESA
jgi:hypothetical protein